MTVCEQQEWTRMGTSLIDTIVQLPLSSAHSLSVDEMVLQLLYTSIVIAHAISIPIPSDLLVSVADFYPGLRDICNSTITK